MFLQSISGGDRVLRLCILLLWGHQCYAVREIPARVAGPDEETVGNLKEHCFVYLTNLLYAATETNEGLLKLVGIIVIFYGTDLYQLLAYLYTHIITLLFYREKYIFMRQVYYCLGDGLKRRRELCGWMEEEECPKDNNMYLHSRYDIIRRWMNRWRADLWPTNYIAYISISSSDGIKKMQLNISLGRQGQKSLPEATSLYLLINIKNQLINYSIHTWQLECLYT